MDWQPAPKPAELAESRLLEAILSGRFPPNSTLPGERELAEQIGVTRPTLREALQRLARDGWLDIQHGKPTRVRDYLQEGGLGVLAVLGRAPQGESPDFVAHLLEVRLLLAPAYTRQALEADSAGIAAALQQYPSLPDEAPAFARADWDLHILLTRRAVNPIFRFLFNGFTDLAVRMGERYFVYPECRAHSRRFYTDLLTCARSGASFDAEVLTRRVMEESLALWQEKQGG
ncbi:MAG: fatty acid metabolism transcriptional regulator FadR [Anaerolineales bacterium]